jgi:hypothetical protein
MRYLLLLSLTLTTLFSTQAQIWDFAGVNALSGQVNSTAEESLPIFSKDSSLLYFIRTMDKRNKGGEYDQDIWLSYRNADGSYGEGKQESSLNTKYNNGVVGMSADGSEIYLLNTYEGKKDLVKGIAIAKKKGNSWGTPEKVEVPTLDIEGDFYGFHISEDGKVLLISYKGPGTLGEEDIYVSLKSETGWSAPMNIGTDINTTGFEMSPFLSKNQDTLFFSSNGHGGQGDADIFYSVRKDSWTSWGKPVNLGPKINTSKFDACFSYSGNTVYWASNRDGELSDIYTAYFIYPPPLVVSCTAKDASFHQGADGRVDLTVEGGAEPFTFAWSNGMQTEDIMGLPKGDYTVVVRDSYRQEAIATCSVGEPAPVEFEPVDVATWKNLEFMHYFDYNKNKLTTSKGDLKKFVKEIESQLKAGRPKITINVYSSASKVPTKTYETNEKLTQIRAENMKYDLTTYFESKPEYAGKVNVVIVSAIVDGPEYVQDAVDTKKYKPYQFVGLKTE